MTPEQSLIGSVLVGGRQVFRSASASVEPADFSDSRHEVIWKQMLSMDGSGLGIDLVTVTGMLEASGRLERAGGYAYLTSLLDEIPDIDNLPSYARLIVDARTKRELEGAIERASMALGSGSHPVKVVEELQRAVRHTLKRDASPHVSEISALVDKGNADIRTAIRNQGRLSGVLTGFRELDALTGGLQPGDVFVIGARTGLGKSALAISIIHQAALAGKSILFCSLEMAAKQVEMRLRSVDSGVDIQRIRLGALNERELESLDESGRRLAGLKIVIDDTPSIGIAEIGARAQKLSLSTGLDIVVVDYLQLMGKAQGSTRSEQIGYNAYQLKGLAKELGVVVLALSQISRLVEREEREPTLADLKESAAIEEAADGVLLLHKDPDEEIAKVSRMGILAKQRNGPTGRVGFAWHGPTASFREPVRIVGQPEG